jgi:exodeoxyribonuclease VII large subunit
VNCITVSTLNTQIKSILENTFFQVYVQGEISNLTYHSSGHIYFSIKDKDSAIKAVMFRGNASKLKFRLEVGQTVLINCAVTVYVPRGDYQLNCFNIEPYGIGNLHLAYEQLKEDLKQKGYFDPSNKKELPKIVKHIGIVTSSTGAAIQDMVKVATNRWSNLKITLFDTIVQGENAKYSIVDSINLAQEYDDIDVLVVGRGGGSFEDLFCFSEEIVAQAVYECDIPVVSAVGHESDFAIIDFISDVRASTPSNAIEIILPDCNEYLQYLDDLIDRLHYVQKNRLLNFENSLNSISHSIKQNSIDVRLERVQFELNTLKKEYFNLFKNILIVKYNSCKELRQILKLKAESVLRSKFDLIANLNSMYKYNIPKKDKSDLSVQVVKKSKVIKLNQLKVGDEVSLQNSDMFVDVKVINKGKFLI